MNYLWRGRYAGRILLFPPEDAKHLSAGFLGQAEDQIKLKDDVSIRLKRICQYPLRSYISAISDASKLNIMISHS